MLQGAGPSYSHVVRQLTHKLNVAGEMEWGKVVRFWNAHRTGLWNFFPLMSFITSYYTAVLIISGKLIQERAAIKYSIKYRNNNCKANKRFFFLSCLISGFCCIMQDLFVESRTGENSSLIIELVT